MSGWPRSETAVAVAGEQSEKKPREAGGTKPKGKNGPQPAAAARELRDRYLEHVNGRSGEAAGALPMSGKYNVPRTPQRSRAIGTMLGPSERSSRVVKRLCMRQSA